MHLKDFFLKLLEFESITPKEAGAFDFICTHLRDFEATVLEKEGIKNLILTKKFNSSGVHLAFGGHIDVVPAGSGWTSEPFKPLEKEGLIYARGASDMKSGLAAFIMAAKSANFKGSRLTLIITSDEEGEAKYGTLEALRYLESKRLLPDFAVVAEPTCTQVFGDTIKIGRRGSINGTLVIKGTQGHVAYPEKCVNPIHLFAPVLAKLAGFGFDAGSAEFSASKLIFTDIRGGIEVCNVTPSALKLMFNIRNSPQTSLETVQAHIEKLCAPFEYSLDLRQSSKPFLTDKNSLVARNLSACVQDVAGVLPEFSTGGGTSDARYFAEFGVSVVEFGVRNESIHAANEHVKFSEVEALCEIFTRLIERF